MSERERVLTTRELNRALLARQLLLERSRAPLVRALEQVAGLQAQYAPSAYIRLWSSLDRFVLGDLTRALERRRAVQATLMRSTIHVVSARDFWLFAEGVRRFRLEWWRHTHGKQLAGVDMDSVSRKVAAELGDGVWQRDHLVELCRAHDPTGGTAVWQGLPLDLVRVPPSGTWELRRAHLFATAESWVGTSSASEAVGLEHLLRRYLRGFGPARLADAASWAGVPAAVVGEVAERLEVRTFRDEEGKKLLDLPRAPLPEGGAPAPVRFLPTWDATMLVHRTSRSDPPGALPAARLQHEDAALGADIHRRRSRRGQVARRALDPESDACAGALRRATPRSAARSARRGRSARPLPRARRRLARCPAGVTPGLS